METIPRPDTDDDEPGAKLIPEWSVDADDQVVLAGLAVLAALILFFGWGALRSRGDDVATVASSVVASPTVPGADDLAAPAIAVATGAPTTTEAPAESTSTTSAPATTAAAAAIGDDQANRVVLFEQIG